MKEQEVLVVDGGMAEMTDGFEAPPLDEPVYFDYDNAGYFPEDFEE